ncbi:MAG: VWA domain-containing protein [Pseudomonadota bacterium]
MKNKILLRTVLAVAITAAVAACNSNSSERDDANTLGHTLPAPASTPVLDETSQALEEVQVTGSRIRREVSGKAAATQQAADAMMANQSVAASYAPVMEMRPVYGPPADTEKYADLVDNGIHRTGVEPVSTFSIDVDTGSYSNVRRFLSSGQLPPADAVRTEELINYFAYDYPRADGDEPFSFATEIAASPWHAGKHLLHIGIQAVDAENTEHKNSNLVFLVDVSGSMESEDKLGLLKTSLKMLSRQLSADDSIAIVVYAGAAGVVLEPTAGNKTAAISRALDRLSAGGSTNGAAGIEEAYALAEQQFIEGGINRVLLATDGDFNVGMTDFDALKKLIEEKRRSGISLTTLGFGTGNYNDQLMEQLADAGNGNYAYIDNINEARKVLVDEMSSTLQTVAKDVKIQIEFNPAVVSEYRLVGYENRVLAQEDFNNDKVDAGEIGVGHTVTALYEISLAGSTGQSVDPLRYNNGTDVPESVADNGNELAYLKLRYKEPDGDTSQLLERPLLVSDIVDDMNSTSTTYRFAAAVAGFSQLLRDNKGLGDFDYEDVLGLAAAAKDDDEFGYRSEFINLVKTAQALSVGPVVN